CAGRVNAKAWGRADARVAVLPSTIMAWTTGPDAPSSGTRRKHESGRNGACARRWRKPMTVDRLRDVPGFSIDRVADAAGADPDVLRLENLDTDLRPPEAALEATWSAIGEDDANSYLPFLGRPALREAAARHVSRLSG